MASASMSNNSREYCLRWNNHQPNMATYFSSLYSSESLVDVTLVSAEGNKVLCHKLVLSACSPYFQHIFESNPCRHPVVILKDVQHSDLEAIVKFIYNGEVNISQDRMTPILKTANSLQVKGLAEVPADELKRVSSVVGGSGGDPLSSLNRPHKTPLLASSLSWDTSDSAHDIPRKKLKKSASTSYASGSLNTNGDHSTSVDSGVGASVSKSIDESSPPDETPPTVLHKRVSIPAPPPLLPKSRSLDLHRDDHEMNMAEHHQRQSYDDSSVDRFDRGYDLEVAEEMKMEGNEEEEYDEGEEYYGEEGNGGEYYDEEGEEEEGFAFYYSQDQTSSSSNTPLNGKPSFIMPTLKSSRPQTHASSSTANTHHVRDLLHASSIRFSNGPVFRRRSERTVMDPIRLEKAMEFLRQGATYREAASKFGFSKTYLWHRSRQHGVTSRKPGIRPLTTVKEEDVGDHSSDNQESNEATMSQVLDFENTSADPSSMAETHWGEEEEMTPTTTLQGGAMVDVKPALKGGLQQQQQQPRSSVKFLPNVRRFIHPTSQS